MLIAAAGLSLGSLQAAAQQPPSSPVRPPAVPSGRPSPNLPAFTWWKSPAFKAEVGLTSDQSARIDKIWEATRPELRQEWEELSRLESKLSKMIQNDVDEAALSRQIDRVETARANANKTRAMMLVQMRKVLSQDQRVRLDAIHERWKQDVQRQIPVPDSRQTTPSDADRSKDESARLK